MQAEVISRNVGTTDVIVWLNTQGTHIFQPVQLHQMNTP
jgi:hypothetical protein